MEDINLQRQKTMMTYMHHRHHLCACSYNFLHGIGSHRVKYVKTSYLMHGLTTCTHSNSNKAPANTLSYQSICQLVKFIRNFAEQHAILLPGRIPQLKDVPLVLIAKRSVTKQYNMLNIHFCHVDIMQHYHQKVTTYMFSFVLCYKFH